MTKARHKIGRGAFLIACLFTGSTQAVSLTGCSSQNTGANGQSSNSLYMSNGQCQTNCQGYAFAITQWQNCWCSNYAPGSTESTDSCSQQCPGYPPELCGDAQQGLFGYVALGKAPEGTMGAGGSSSAAATPSAPSSQPAQTVVQVSTQVQTFVPSSTVAPSTVTPVTIVQTSVQQNTETQVTSLDPSTAFIAGPTSIVSSVDTVTPSLAVTSAQAVTVGGSVVTRYITSTPSVMPKPTPANEEVKPTKQGLSSGAVAGITIASLLGAAILAAALIFLLCWRRRKNHVADGEGGPKRNASVLSRVGLLRNSNQTDDQSPGAGPTLPRIRTSGIPMVDSGPESAMTMGSSQWSDNRRLSRPLFHDSRLNPNALMTQPNLSRTSMSTLQDNQDYSRPLEVRNPDAPSLRHA